MVPSDMIVNESESFDIKISSDGEFRIAACIFINHIIVSKCKIIIQLKLPISIITAFPLA